VPTENIENTNVSRSEFRFESEKHVKMNSSSIGVNLSGDDALSSECTKVIADSPFVKVAALWIRE
jgi:hypothetical protein